MNATNKTYLGDGVYAALENGMIRLTTEDGVSVLDRIYLDIRTVLALKRFIESVEGMLE